MRDATRRTIRIAHFACLVLAGGARAAILPESTGVPPTEAAIGVKGGISFSRLAWEDHDTEWRQGFVGGLHLDLPASPVFMVRGELLYHEAGARQVLVGTTLYHGQPPTVPIYKNARRSYLELGFLARYRPVGSDVYWLAGPNFGVLLSRSETFAKAYEPSDYWDLTYLTDWYFPNQVLDQPARTNGSLLFGIGTMVQIGTTGLLLEARYQLGLQNINSFSWYTLHDRSVTVLTGVGF